MANKYFKGEVKTYEGGVVKLFGNFTTTTSGTIGTSSCKGFSVAKTGSETGRYTITLEDQYNGFLGCAVTLVGPDDSAITDATTGVIPIVRNIDVTNSAKTFYVQFLDPTDSSDAEIEDAASVYLEITLKNSSVF